MRLRLVFARFPISALAGVHSLCLDCRVQLAPSSLPAAVWPELPAGSGATCPLLRCLALAGPSSAQNHRRPFHSIPLPFICLAPGRGNPQKKFEISDTSRQHINLRILPAHCQTCVVSSHRRHVCRTASEPEGRVEGTPSRVSGPPTGGLLLTVVDRGGVRRCGSTSAPARGSRMSSSPTWARWAPSRCTLASPILGAAVSG